MHNIKEIRTNIEGFKKSLQKRYLDLNVDVILELDEKNRKFIHDKENFKKEKKEISKFKDKTLFEKSKVISIEIDKISKLQSDIKNKLDNILSSIPNIPLNDVPLGKDESSNKEILQS